MIPRTWPCFVITAVPLTCRKRPAPPPPALTDHLAERARDVLITVTGHVLVDQRGTRRAVTHARHQLPGARPGPRMPACYRCGADRETSLGMPALCRAAVESSRKLLRRGRPSGGPPPGGQFSRSSDTPVPTAIAPGRTEQTRPLASGAFVQWGSPPGRQEPHQLPMRAGRRQTGWEQGLSVAKVCGELKQVVIFDRTEAARSSAQVSHAADRAWVARRLRRGGVPDGSDRR
jgi:hypothetical protein